MRLKKFYFLTIFCVCKLLNEEFVDYFKFLLREIKYLFSSVSNVLLILTVKSECLSAPVIFNGLILDPSDSSRMNTEHWWTYN
jgi:hypothetical protein